jgi:alpha-1,2-mannosyltransferase
MVYQAAGDALIHGIPLYAHGLHWNMMFVYPPLAAIMFIPVALVPLALAKVASTVANIALLVLAIRACWRAVGLRPGADLRNVTLLTSGLLLWLDPVRTTLYLGQINLLVLALVLLDLLRHGRRWQGVGLGIAAGIKLTPLVFLPYLLLTRRFRAAAVAAGTFLGTILLGFLVAPRDSATFWLHGTFADARRMSPVNSGSNFSLHGLLARQFGLTSQMELLWLACATVLGLAGIGAAVLAQRRGHELFGVALTGLVSATVSPFSWTHHWVWFVPLAVFGMHRMARKPGPATWLPMLALYVATCAVLTTFPSRDSIPAPGTGLVSLNLPGLVGWLCTNVYTLLCVGTTVLAAAALLKPKGKRGFGLTQSEREDNAAR